MPEYKDLDEVQLIKLLQQGERSAFAPLVSRYKNQVFNLVLRTVRDFHQAEEISQEVFIRAFKGLAEFKFESKFSTWLTRITLNCVISYSSSRYARQKGSTDLAADFESSQISSEEELLAKEKYKVFHSCYLKLSEKLQRTMILIGFQNCSYEESAEILKVPVGTIRSRTNQARLLLLECMSKTYGDVL